MHTKKSSSLGAATLPGQLAGRPSRLARRQRSSAVTLAKKKPDYGSGRARLPGLADMPGLEGAVSGSGGSPAARRPPTVSISSGASSSRSDLGGKGGAGSRESAGKSTGNSSGSRDSPGGGTGGGTGGGRESTGSSSSTGSIGISDEEPTLAEYLHFGRLMGDRPQQVRQQLDMSGMRVQVDPESQQYLQSWEREDVESYAMFEAVVAAEASRGASPAGSSAAFKKLQKNKNIVSSAATAEQLRQGARTEFERGVPMTAAQRALAKNKRNAGGVGASMRSSMEALMREAASSEDEEGGFELVAATRPTRPSSMLPAQLASKPTRPTEFEEYEDEEDDIDFDEMWAEVEEAGSGVAARQAAARLSPPPVGPTYDAFNSLLSQSGGKGATGKGKPEGSTGSLTGAPSGRPAKPQPPSQQAAAAAGRVQISFRKPATGPMKLSAKPQASSAARDAAQRPLPPPPAPEPTLSSKPSRPAAAVPPAAPAEPAATPKPVEQQAPPLAAKPQAAAKPQVAAAQPAQPPVAAPKPARPAAPARLVAPSAPAALAKPAQPKTAAAGSAAPAAPARPAQPKAAAGAAAPAAPARPAQPKAAAVAAAPAVLAKPAQPKPAAQPAAPAAPAKPAQPKAAAEAAAAAAPAKPAQPQGAAQPAAPAAAAKPAQPKAAAATAELAAAAKPAAAAAAAPAAPAEAAAVAPQRPAAPRPQGQEATPQQQASAIQRMREGRRAANAAYGIECLLDRRAEVLTVWQVNAAGVLVRNERLSGFVPTSLLSPVHVTRVLETEQQLAAAAAAGLIVVQLETDGAPASAAQGADLDTAARSSVRRSALEAVMMGQQLTARVVNVDEKSGRVVLSERAAVSAWKDRGTRAALPTTAELLAAAAQLGEVVDCTVVVVKPFGCFVEFAVTLPAQPAATGEPQQAQQEQQQRQHTVVGLVHSSEVSWNPAEDLMQTIKVGQRVRAKLMHVDTQKSRIFLSLRRTAPNPLLETLDSLVTSSAAAAAAAAADEDASSALGPGSRSSGSGSDSTPASGGGGSAALDQRPVLGDLPEAARFCELLEAAPGVRSATLGVRLQSRAASQSLEVYIAKSPASGIGAAVAAVSGAGSSVGSTSSGAGASGASSYNLVLRKEQSVQEVALVADLSRDEVRQLASDCVALLATQAEAGATSAA